MKIPPRFLATYYQTLARQEVPADRLPRLAAALEGLLGPLADVREPGPWGHGPAATFDPCHPAWSAERDGRADQPSDLPSATVSIDPADKAAPGALDLLDLDAGTIACAVRRRRISAEELTQACLERAESLGRRLNAFITVTADLALDAARRIDGVVALGGDPGPLAGVPVGLKDLFETAGIRTTAGSLILSGHVPEADAQAVTLLRQAGAIFPGKTSTHEFAFGATTDNPHYGPARNPWDLSRIPGGSSGGSGAGVAAGLFPAAMGTDTGGSIRIPAALCGVVGLKPTYGLVSRRGVMPLSWSLDHPGPLARHAIDIARLLAVLAGPDPADPATRPRELPDYVAWAQRGAAGLSGMRLGVLEDWMADRVDAGVREAVLRAVGVLEDMGAFVQPVRMPSLDEMVRVNRLLALPEAAAIHAPFLRDRAEDYGDDVRIRLEVGLAISARDYLVALERRGELCREVARTMASVDLLALPTTPITAPLIGAGTADWGHAGTETVPEALIRFTAPFNVTGQPAISIPCGLSGGLPVGLQLVGRPMQDHLLIQAAAALQEAADWTAVRPPL